MELDALVEILCYFDFKLKYFSDLVLNEYLQRAGIMFNWNIQYS